MYKSWWKLIYTKYWWNLITRIYKINDEELCKTVYWTKKIKFKKWFSRNFKGFYGEWFWINDYNLFIYKKRSFNLFSINYLIQFHLYLIFKKSYLYLLYQKNLLKNFNLATKIILLDFFRKWWIFTILFTKVFWFIFIKKKWFLQII